MVDLSGLRAVPAARASLDATELSLIDQARREGATWADIAAALGLSSRQAAEQRRLRLATAALRVPPDLDERYGEQIAALRTAAAELHRRIGADRRWDSRFPQAKLVRETLAAAPDAPAGSLFALVAAVVRDFSAGPSPAGPSPAGPSPAGRTPARSAPAGSTPAGPALPGPTRAAVDRLRAAWGAARPQT
jgi:hypothetical protein